MIMKFLLHKDNEEKENATAHSGTFGWPKASQPKEPSFSNNTNK